MNIISKHIINNQHKNINNLSFKGYTTGPEAIWQSCGYSTTGPSGYISGYKVPQGATSNYPGAYPNKDTKIYKAAPFEIISEDIYKKHDYTIRDDLRLSQIQKEYKTGYHNFASNAWNEKRFLEGLAYDSEHRMNKNKYLAEEYQKRLDFVESDSIKQKYADKIKASNKEVEKAAKDYEPYREPIQNANERFKLLKALDDKMGEINSTRDELYRTGRKIQDKTNPTTEERKITEGLDTLKYLEYEKNIAVRQAEQDFKNTYALEEERAAINARYEVRINRQKKYIESIKKEIANGKAEIPALMQKCDEFKNKISQLYKELDVCMANVEKLYKAKFSHWL